MSAVSTPLWGLIDAALEQRPGDLDAQIGSIRESLAAQSSEQVIAFGKQMSEALVRANHWDLWGAAYIIGDGCSDDGFLYFRGWLLMQGQQMFEATVWNPDVLAEVPGLRTEGCECEGVLSLPLEVYRDQTGQELPQAWWSGVEDTPSGKPWHYTDLQNRLPRLWSVYGEA